MQPEVDDLPRTGSPFGSDASSLAGDEIDFLGYSKNYFVCFIDIVDSTKIVSRIDNSQNIRKYYGIFLNTVARIARDHGGTIVKSAGDSLILYFPNTTDTEHTDALRIAMWCCLEILDAHESMNLVANFEHLPAIDYRISADYGKVEVAKSRSSTGYDLLGNTMNICAKMNSKAKPQGFVIGSDLYEILRASKLGDLYDFRPVGEYSTGFRYNYPVFAVHPKGRVRNGVHIPYIQQQFDSHNPVKRRIMIVDDEPDVLLTYKSMLEDEALFEIETYTSSQDALQRLFSTGASAYDLIITDIRMPPPNGLQLYNIIKSINRQTRVLLITAYDVIEEVVSMLPDIKHEHVLKKPLNKQDLIKEARLCIA